MIHLWDLCRTFIDCFSCNSFYNNNFIISDTNIDIYNHFIQQAYNGPNKILFKFANSLNNYDKIVQFKNSFNKNNFTFLDTNYKPHKNSILKKYYCAEAIVISIENLNVNFWTNEILSDLKTPTNLENTLGYRVDRNEIFKKNLNLNSIKYINRVDYDHIQELLKKKKIETSICVALTLFSISHGIFI